MGKWSKYGKHYSSDWENEEKLKEWIRRTPGDKTKANCRFCSTDIRAHHSDLVAHSNTEKHNRNAVSYYSNARTLLSTDFQLKDEDNLNRDNDNVNEIAELKLALQVACQSSIRTIDHLSNIVRELGGKDNDLYRGQVYPQETKRTSGHTIQWSQAVISKPAPDWNGTAVIKGEFKDIKLADFRGKYLVFFFYPLDFTFVCPTEIIAFSDSMEDFRKINTELVGCSVDSQFTHLAWTNVPRNQGGLGKINFPLLSDITHEISKAYGVYLQDLGHSLRGLFIIDPKGTLRQITMNDLPVGRSVDETLRLVQAFQYTDKHGEVCPAGWKPGSDTIIPDPKKAQEYFKKHPISDDL